ncbi:MAG: hypothetical protein JWP58_2798 [Hymenobacter sp.]|nr:hypothetical protein [Hymenobacter sp.]
MARRAAPSDNLLARTRAWFGLDQAALALYLGVSLELIRSVETGRRRLSGEVFMAFRPLVQHLPPPEAAPAPAAALAPGTPAPDASALDFRRRVCQHQAARCANEMAVIEHQARVAQHWAQALPALRQAAAEALPDPDNPGRGAWLMGWLTRHARPLPAESATRWHLLRARLAALTAEAAALAEGAVIPGAQATTQTH